MKIVISLLLVFAVSLSVVGQISQVNKHFFESHKEPADIDRFESDNSGIDYSLSGINNKYSKLYESHLDAKQRLDSIIIDDWSESNNQWIHDYKFEFTFDTYGNITHEYFYNWEAMNNVYINTWKYDYFYDNNANLTQEIHHDWDEILNQWIADYKYEYIYNTNGYNTNKTYLYRNNNQWDPLWKAEYIYDANWFLIQENIYNWDGSQWRHESKYVYTYDANGNLIEEIYSHWNENNSNWLNDYKLVNIYNANGKLALKTDYNWDNYYDNWIADSKDEYSYDYSGKLTQIIIFDSLQSTSQWVFDFKYDYSYDENGNLTQQEDYYWDETTSQWITTWKYVSTYNNLYLFDELILPNFEVEFDNELEMYFWHMLTGYVAYTWDESTLQWIFTAKGTYYYSEQNIGGLSDIKARDINIFPNPTDDFFVLEVKNITHPIIIEIFDFQGKKVLQQNAFEDSKVYVDQLKSGLYLCKFSYNGKLYNEKLIVR